MNTEKDKRGPSKITVHWAYSQHQQHSAKVMTKKLLAWVSHAPRLAFNNTYIVDASVRPIQGSGTPPFLIKQALAFRTASLNETN